MNDPPVTRASARTAPEGPPKSAAVTLTISEAARACAVTRGTVRHHRQAGDFPGAFKDQDGMWRIPMEDLEWVGLHADLARASEDPIASGKVDLLRTEVAVLRERLRAAELIAVERERRIDDLRLILRLLPSTNLPASSLGTTRLSPGHGVSLPGLSAGTDAPEAAPPQTGAGESDPVIWLPDAPDARPVPVRGPIRSAETGEGSIWTPVGSSPPRNDADERPERPERDEPITAPRFLGPPVNVRTQRSRWLPWRRSRG